MAYPKHLFGCIGHTKMSTCPECVPEIKVRTANGRCYYTHEQPDENGNHHGVSKYTDTDAFLRRVDDEWVVVWEAPFVLER
jgi:hypothetical protein